MISREQQQRDPVGTSWWRTEAGRLRAENAVLRAENVVLRAENVVLRAESAGLRERIADLEGQVGALAAKVATLARLAFGKSTEKKNAKGPAAGDDGGGTALRRAGAGRVSRGVSGLARAGMAGATT